MADDGICGASGMLVEQATQRLNREILAGSLRPGTKLRVQSLSARLGLGGTPIREALWRLCSIGLVRAVENRGFRVSEISREDLQDIISTRQLIEVEALTRSMRRGGDEWEAGIVATLHRLKIFTARGQQALREGHAEFDVIHKSFHTQLLSACGSERMLDMHKLLYDQTYRYRFTSPQGFSRPEHLDREHEILAELALARDEAAGCARLAKHLNSTLTMFDAIGAAPVSAAPE